MEKPGTAFWLYRKYRVVVKLKSNDSYRAKKRSAVDCTAAEWNHVAHVFYFVRAVRQFLFGSGVTVLYGSEKKVIILSKISQKRLKSL